MGVPAATNVRSNICTCIVPLILLLFLVPLFLYLLLQLSTQPIATTLPPIAVPAPAPVIAPQQHQRQQLPCPTIAMPVIRIGREDGLPERRLIAVKPHSAVARQRPQQHQRRLANATAYEQ